MQPEPSATQGAGAGAKVVPVTSNPFKTKPAPSVGSAALATSPVAQQSAPQLEPQLGNAEVEIPEVKPAQPEETGDINKMVDKAFEDELKSTARTEAQTIQIDTLSKVISGCSALATAATGLAISAKDSAAQSDEIDPAKRLGAQVKARSANVRPVDLARQAESDDFDRVGLEGSTDKSKGNVELPKEEPSVAAVGSGNPFLKDRPAKVSKSLGPSDDGSVVPVPDQIRKLADSIASFAKPVKSGSKQEKF